MSWFLNVRTYRLFLTYRKPNKFCFWTVWQNILASGHNGDAHFVILFLPFLSQNKYLVKGAVLSILQQ